MLDGDPVIRKLNAKIAELEAGYEIQMRKCDAAQAKNESDAKVIAALREALFEIAQMPPLQMMIPGVKEPKVFDAEQKIARAALLTANEQHAGDTK